MDTKPCIDCGHPRPHHTSNCPGWTDADYAALEAEEENKAMRDDPWSYLLEAAKESLYPGPSASMARAQKKLRKAIRAVEDSMDSWAKPL